MKLGIYVGSFNPVHKGHKYIMNYLLDKNIVDKIIVIPTGNYWDKQDLINIRDRINMLKFYESDKVLINETLNEINYTYEILKELEEEYKNDKLYLIIGADNIPKFHLWKNVNQILKYKVIILSRDNIDIDKYINKFKNKDNFVVVKDFKKVNISSTQIRNNLEDNKELIDKKIYKYIKDNKLYLQ